jgi:hypothetical protein
MKKKNILVSWLGHTDLKAMAQDSSVSIKKSVEEVVGSIDDKIKIGLGPIKTLTSQVKFDSFFLLSNYKNHLNKAFSSWVECNPTLWDVELKNPTDYHEVYSIVESKLKALYAKEGREQSYNFLLSPGTPAMAAIWILLGKTKYPAQFYQTYNGKYWTTEVPFDITVDVIPELLQDTDAYLQQFASKSPQVRSHESPSGRGFCAG